MPAPEPWTLRQRRALALILAVVWIVLSIRLLNRRVMVASPPPPEPLAQGLSERIDPNTADAAMLLALPDFGEKRVEALLDYRRRWANQHPGRAAFRTPDDLLLVKGIGDATLERLEPYLKFPSPSVSAPAKP